MFDKMAEIIPPGAAGVARVEHLVVTEEQAKFQALRAAINPHRGERPVEPGTLCQLFVNGRLMMSDAENEHATNAKVLHRAHGDVLIAGLGIGMVLMPILRKPGVKTVTVVELHADVDVLVAGYLRNAVTPEQAKKLNIVVGNAFTWNPPKELRFDVIYFDIWPNISTDNLVEITKLKRKYARRLRRENPTAWMGAWCEQALHAKKRRESKEQFVYGGYAREMGECGHAK